ncbi:MAG: hypothetical protein L3J39_11910 [Verrucomicrobiales bacterium]|nr:hypothetical protein [Verrucomicrobiales bacterium]
MKIFLINLSILHLALLTCAHAGEGQNWAQWRGPQATGSASVDVDPPITWSEQQHLKWKTPIVDEGFAWLGSSCDTRALMAIRLKGAKGDISESDHIVWSRKKRTPYVPSPLLYKETLYYLAHYQPILSRAIAKTGEDLPGPLRLNGLRSLYASPVAAANRIYLTDLAGTTLVISHSKDMPKVLATNHLEDSFSASPVIVGKQLFLRGKNLYCLSRQQP